MRTYVIAGGILLALTMPAAAKTKYYVVMDTVRNCSVIEAKPSAGLKVIKGAFRSEQDAKAALAKVAKKKNCQGVVE